MVGMKNESPNMSILSWNQVDGNLGRRHGSGRRISFEFEAKKVLGGTDERGRN